MGMFKGSNETDGGCLRAMKQYINVGARQGLFDDSPIFVEFMLEIETCPGVQLYRGVYFNWQLQILGIHLGRKGENDDKPFTKVALFRVVAEQLLAFGNKERGRQVSGWSQRFLYDLGRRPGLQDPGFWSVTRATG